MRCSSRGPPFLSSTNIQRMCSIDSKRRYLSIRCICWMVAAVMRPGFFLSFWLGLGQQSNYSLFFIGSSSSHFGCWSAGYPCARYEAIELFQPNLDWPDLRNIDGTFSFQPRKPVADNCASVCAFTAIHFFVFASLPLQIPFILKESCLAWLRRRTMSTRLIVPLDAFSSIVNAWMKYEWTNGECQCSIQYTEGSR